MLSRSLPKTSGQEQALASGEWRWPRSRKHSAGGLAGGPGPSCQRPCRGRGWVLARTGSRRQSRTARHQWTHYCALHKQIQSNGCGCGNGCGPKRQSRCAALGLGCLLLPHPASLPLATHYTEHSLLEMDNTRPVYCGPDCPAVHQPIALMAYCDAKPAKGRFWETSYSQNYHGKYSARYISCNFNDFTPVRGTPNVCRISRIRQNGATRFLEQFSEHETTDSFVPKDIRKVIRRHGYPCKI